MKTQHHLDVDRRRRDLSDAAAMQERMAQRRREHMQKLSAEIGLCLDAWSGPVRSAEQARNRMIQRERG